MEWITLSNEREQPFGWFQRRKNVLVFQMQSGTKELHRSARAQPIGASIFLADSLVNGSFQTLPKLCEIDKIVTFT